MDTRISVPAANGAQGKLETGAATRSAPDCNTPPALPLFEERALPTLERARSTFAGRGVEYGDSWRECRFLKMRAVAKELGAVIPDEAFRAIATAALCDMKYYRFAGGFKDDNLIDGINYDAFLAEEMRVLTQKQ